MISERSKRIQPAEVITWSWKKARSWLVSGQVGELAGWLTAFALLAGLTTWLFAGAILWLLAVLLGKLVTRQGGRIRRAEATIWSWEKAGYGVLVGLLTGLMTWFFAPFLPSRPMPGVSPMPPPLSRSELASHLLLSYLLFGAILWLLIGLLAGLSVNQLTERVHLSPNEGIQRSGRNGLLVGLLIGAGTNLIVGLIAGIIAGLFTGLDACVRHFTLRFWLWRMNWLPWNMISFLDETAERLLLCKVGGGYSFVHRLLLDYFASLEQHDR